MWYNPHELLSHNCLFNFLIGNRGAGKTFSFKEWAVKDFLKTGKQFVYIRRYKSELKKSMLEKFFSAVKFKFPAVEFDVKGMTFYINGEVAGYAIPLSVAITIKSEEFVEVNKICFDEFVIDKGHLHYLPNEVVSFLELYETIARLREGVRVLFLSNAVSIVNPYFLWFNLQPNGKKRFTKYGHILVEFVQNDEFKEAKYKTKFGQIIKGTKYGDYAIENQFLKDNSHFVEKKTGDARFEFSIVFNGHTYGFWNDYKGGAVYVSADVDPFSKLQFVLTNEDHQPNMKLIKNANSSFLLKSFMKAYEGGWMRFESMQIKNQAIEIFRLLKGGGR